MLGSAESDDSGTDHAECAAPPQGAMQQQRAATAEQRGVGGVDDGVDCQRDDVRFKRLQNVAC